MISTVTDSRDDLRTRLAILESEVAQLREQLARSRSDAAAARILAAGADRDAAEARAELRAYAQARTLTRNPDSGPD